MINLRPLNRRAAGRARSVWCAAMITTVMLTQPSHAVEPDAAQATTLTLTGAVERALADSPRIAAELANVAAAEGTAKQAGFRPNPSLVLEAENIAGSGPYRALEGSVYTLSMSQTIELGGKRTYRQAAARRGVDLTQYQLADERLALIQGVRVAYARVIAAQEQLKLAVEHRQLAQALLHEIQKRVEAAREPALQLSKAQIALANAQLVEDEQARELQHAQHVLNSFWRGGHESFIYDSAPLFKLTPPVTEEALEAALHRHPIIHYRQAEHQRQRALLRLDKAGALPDPQFQVGVRQFEETGDQALVMGVSMPLPLFDRNQGSIDHTRAQLAKSVADEHVAEVDLAARGLQALEEMVNAFHRATTLSKTIIPAAERAFALAREGYSAGRFPYLEVLDAERTLFVSKQDYITALGQYQVAKAEVNYVMATDDEAGPREIE